MATNIYIVSPLIYLPADTRKEIEFDSGVEAIQEESADGGIMQWKRARQYRKNALVGGPNVAFIERSVVVSLVALAGTMPGILQLSFISVITDFEFDYAEGNPVTATALIPRPNPATTDIYRNLRIRIIER